MIPEQLKKTERDLRHAVSRREYSNLPALLEELRAAADACIAKLPQNDVRRGEIAGFALKLVDWARLMVTTQRQIWSDELALLPRVSRYLDRPGQIITPPDSAPHVCVDL